MRGPRSPGAHLERASPPFQRSHPGMERQRRPRRVTCRTVRCAPGIQYRPWVAFGARVTRHRSILPSGRPRGHPGVPFGGFRGLVGYFWPNPVANAFMKWLAREAIHMRGRPGVRNRRPGESGATTEAASPHKGERLRVMSATAQSHAGTTDRVRRGNPRAFRFVKGASQRANRLVVTLLLCESGVIHQDTTKTVHATDTQSGLIGGLFSSASHPRR
jgi:hypothetical protein